MDARSIWAVTDFNVPGQPGNFGAGIDLADLKTWLAGCELEDYFTYQFWGIAFNQLDPQETEAERKWLEQSDLHGELFAAAWVKR